MYLQSIKSVNRSILKKSRRVGFGVFIVHSSMANILCILLQHRYKPISVSSELTGLYSRLEAEATDHKERPARRRRKQSQLVEDEEEEGEEEDESEQDYDYDNELL
jgi:hypothetical protein